MLYHLEYTRETFAELFSLNLISLTNDTCMAPHTKGLS